LKVGARFPVKRNAEKFPEGYILRMTDEECSRSQIVTLNGGRGSNLKYLPYADAVPMRRWVVANRLPGWEITQMTVDFQAGIGFEPSAALLERGVDPSRHNNLGLSWNDVARHVVRPEA